MEGGGGEEGVQLEGMKYTLFRSVECSKKKNLCERVYIIINCLCAILNDYH